MFLTQVLHPVDLSRSENKEGYNKKENDSNFIANAETYVFAALMILRDPFFY